MDENLFSCCVVWSDRAVLRTYKIDNGKLTLGMLDDIASILGVIVVIAEPIDQTFVKDRWVVQVSYLSQISKEELDRCVLRIFEGKW